MPPAAGPRPRTGCDRAGRGRPAAPRAARVVAAPPTLRGSGPPGDGAATMHDSLRWTSRVVRLVAPLWCIRELVRGGGSRRWWGALGLLGIWSYAYRSYRRRSVLETARARELL